MTATAKIHAFGLTNWKIAASHALRGFAVVFFSMVSLEVRRIARYNR